MNIQPTFMNVRSHLSHTFFTLRTDARREALWAKLMGKTTELATFPAEAPEKSPNRIFSGTVDIPVGQIVGTVNRQRDFDHKFRPLHKQLCERWVDVYLMLESEGWLPILVHKVGENYYVGDGHHRVSIAQALGFTFIQAKVWDYPALAKEPKKCQPEPCSARSSAKVYTGVAD